MSEHSALPWTADPDEREGMEWNIHILDARGNRVCFMTSDGPADINAVLIVKAAGAHAELVAALDGVVLVCGRTGDSLEDFEEQAEAFRRETGFHRPGKDLPAAGGGEDDHDIRRAKFNEWVQSKLAAARAALAKVRP